MNLIVENIHGQDGFRIIERSTLTQSAQEDVKVFDDARHKIIIDNEVPYGHLVTNWLYHLLLQLDRFSSPDNVVILFNKRSDHPGQEMYHLSSMTDYLIDKLQKRGYDIGYLEGQYFEITNLVEPINPPETLYSQVPPPVVAPFLKEGTTTANYGKKIYLSRSKTTTPNGNQGVDLRTAIEKTHLPMKQNMEKIREENKYKFSNRLDDEAKLEKYLESLGFEVLIPEEFDSYQEQLDKISEARILMSVTSASLHAGMILPPESIIVELCTLMGGFASEIDEHALHTLFFHEHYRSMALVQNNPYIAIPNVYRRAQDVIDFIEANPHIKSILKS